MGLAAPGFDTAVAWLTVNSSRVSSPLAIPGAIVAGAAALALTLSACGSDSDSTSATTTSDTTTSTMTTSPTGTAVAQSCPTAAPGEDVAPDWTFTGDTGSIAVTGPTDEAAPLVTVEGPFSVSETRVEVLQDGDGPVVADTADVLVCYLGVNGRDGTVFDTSFERGTPVNFPLDGVITGFQKAIAGQTVGSTVAVAMTPEDGYPDGQPAAGIQPGDSLIFAISILDATD
ncbi:peptidylprolyl isomerase, FKBP-type [Mycolicibacterium thermoresistibile ATCC 19527]|uniref:Peptidyl-prolyl cis-trans isomerase n=2 Tax=Mycolicibacterium thermoresistibile TaxID=1797 RepID=G7CM95_MYCT3|nr:peptidylprolyl isomerase, FKBP-type [Mycolicibacterium thermoresistibile ATCC 19527]MCV7188195.1 FKBP-type peptidyl-prolyl cis-trans isomerase [Mycolicibacterium thermoresistibile]GAT13268.1 peptidyl-prolyl cis-trans isomerase domain-containing protein [Mycolicibacterium thermoresistibile]SNW18558.1 peptidyl-prolyl cis-trans isomerase domain-containing protein [Mycolicibacterium thermoresistibile]